MIISYFEYHGILYEVVRTETSIQINKVVVY